MPSDAIDQADDLQGRVENKDQEQRFFETDSIGEMPDDGGLPGLKATPPGLEDVSNVVHRDSIVPDEYPKEIESFE